MIAAAAGWGSGDAGVVAAIGAGALATFSTASTGTARAALVETATGDRSCP